MNSPVGDEVAHHLALGAIGRDERAEHDEPAFGHQLRHFAGAANVLHPVGLGEAEIAAEPVADVVAVEQHRVVAGHVQPLLDDIGDRRLAGARQPGEPENGRFLMLERGALGLADQERLPMDIGAAAQPERDHAGADGVVGEAVDDDKRAGLPVLLIGIEGDRNGGGEIAEPDVIEAREYAKRDDRRC